MKILVVCGAGASSTFVAMRLRHAAEQRGIPLQAQACAATSLPGDLEPADIVLVGPHLTHELPVIERQTSPRGARVAVLADDVFADLDGTRTLAQVLPLLSGEGYPAYSLTNTAPDR